MAICDGLIAAGIARDCDAVNAAVGVDKDLTTVHGFRHMAVTSLNEKGYNADAIELQVAHQIRGVRGVYNHAKYLEERKPMMEDWSNYLNDLLT